MLILFLAYLVLNLPQASRIADNGLSQAGVELWEGNLMAGRRMVGSSGPSWPPFEAAGPTRFLRRFRRYLGVRIPLPVDLEPCGGSGDR
jgi:hypothetical protein